jgi:hypothetical protein
MSRHMGADVAEQQPRYGIALSSRRATVLQGDILPLSTPAHGLSPAAKTNNIRLCGRNAGKLSTPLHLVSVAAATAIYISKSMTNGPNRPNFSLVRRSCDGRGAGCGPLGAEPNRDGVEGRRSGSRVAFGSRSRSTFLLRLSSAAALQTIAQFWGRRTPA